MQTFKITVNNIEYRIQFSHIGNMPHLTFYCEDLNPLTETGSRSHFLPDNFKTTPTRIKSYCQRLLETASNTPEWSKRKAAAAQLSLF